MNTYRVTLDVQAIDLAGAVDATNAARHRYGQVVVEDWKERGVTAFPTELEGAEDHPQRLARLVKVEAK